MSLYKTFEVTNFRCLSDVRIEGIGRINLIVGRNNAGKSALLESLFIHTGAWNIDLPLRLDLFRGLDRRRLEFHPWEIPPWQTLFPGGDTSHSIVMTSDDRIGRRKTVLREVHDLTKLSELASKLGHIAPDRTEASSGETSAAARVKALEMESITNGVSSTYYYVADASGFRYDPLPPGPPVPVIIVPSQYISSPNTLSLRLSGLQRLKAADLVLEAMRVIEPTTRDIRILNFGEVPVVHVDLGLSELFPLNDVGDGTRRLFEVVVDIGNCPKGVVLIDEIENGFYYETMPRIWETVFKASLSFDTQVFATTHSLECISAAAEARANYRDIDLRVHRIERETEGFRVVSFDADELVKMKSLGFEVR